MHVYLASWRSLQTVKHGRRNSRRWHVAGRRWLLHVISVLRRERLDVASQYSIVSSDRHQPFSDKFGYSDKLWKDKQHSVDYLFLIQSSGYSTLEWLSDFVNLPFRSRPVHVAFGRTLLFDSCVLRLRNSSDLTAHFCLYIRALCTLCAPLCDRGSFRDRRVSVSPTTLSGWGGGVDRTTRGAQCRRPTRWRPSELRAPWLSSSIRANDVAPRRPGARRRRRRRRPDDDDALNAKRGRNGQEDSMHRALCDGRRHARQRKLCLSWTCHSRTSQR